MFNTSFVRRRAASIVWLGLVCLVGLLVGLVKPLVSAPAWARTYAVLPDGTADRVLGQSTFTTAGGEVTASGFGGAAGIGIAPAGSPSAGRIFVVDYTNHRVLSWPSATGFSNGAAADLVLGQSDFTSSAGGLEAYKLFGPEAAVMDASGNLYVADTENNRVLQFRPPFSSGMSASVVLGQPNFVTPNNQANRGGATAANTLNYPRGLGIDASGKLYVTDTGNSRVLRYAPPFSNGMDAELVIGQANFTESAANRNGSTPEANTLSNPKGLAVDSAGHLYVADFGNHRVLRFDPNLSNGQNASKAFGQPSYTEAIANNGGRGAGTLHQPVDIAVSWAGDVLYVTDQLNIRVLGYDTPLASDAEADGVFGQPNFSTAAPNYNGISATSLNQEPLGVAIDANGGLYVADFGNNRVLAYDSAAQPTPTPTPTSPQSTSTPTQTSTGSPTPSPTTLPSPTPQPSVGDVSEPDDTCTVARTINTDGSVQRHTFHQNADSDWVQFNAISGTKYLIEGQTPADSPADLAMEIRDTCSTLTQTSAPNFGAGVREEFVAPFTGPVYLQLINEPPNQYGVKVAYELSVRALSKASATQGAVIIVAGRNQVNDVLQPNIYNVTDQAYRVFQNHGYPADRIRYLAPELRTNVNALATNANLQQAITQWALDKVDVDHPLTLYLMDHGDRDKLFLDKPRNEVLTPELLNGWLSQLEAARPGLKVNVIIEACLSGSFISTPGSISKAGRVIVTSSDDINNAQASFVTGAWFSDLFLLGLDRKQSVYNAFAGAKFAVDGVWKFQRPMLDDNGDGVFDNSDGAQAQQRGFGLAGTLGEDNWPPYITQPGVQPGINTRSRIIRATVRDDKNAITQVFAAVYPPSYVPPGAGEILVNESAISKAVLALESNGVYSGSYPDFSEPGLYRVVIFAKDGLNTQARPVELFVQVGNRVFLPLVVR